MTWLVSALRRGLAEYLAANGVGTWRESSPYLPDEKAITLRDLPDAPDTALAVEVYDISDDVVLPDQEVRVQLLARGRGDAADDMADTAFGVLHGAHHFMAGTVKVGSARRISSAPLGADDNGREERADSYALVLMR